MREYKVEMQVHTVAYRTIKAKNASEAMELVQQQVDEEGLDADVIGAGILAKQK